MRIFNILNRVSYQDFFFIIFLSYLLVGCVHSTKIEEKPISEEIANWELLYTIDSIPPVLIKAMRKITHDDFQIANSTERFRSTDMGDSDSLPTRQMRLLAKDGNKWRLTYIQGGFGKSYIFVEGTVINDSLADLKYAATLFPLENNDSIRKLLNSDQLIPQIIDLHALNK